MSVNTTLVNDVTFQELCKFYFTTDMTIEQVANELETLSTNVSHAWKMLFSDDEVKERKAKMYARSKQGPKNPAYGQKGDQSKKYRNARTPDGKGYYVVLKPDWYTGRRRSNVVFEHSFVMCEALSLTEIPAGFCVHHIDGDKTNNSIHNLALVTTSGHRRIHNLERATTIPEGSRE